MKNFFLAQGKYKNIQDKIFLKDVDGENITYKKFIYHVDLIINYLKKKKIKENDLIILLLSNSILSALVIFAAAKYALKLVTIPANSTLLEINNAKKEYSPKYIISTEKTVSKNTKLKNKIIYLKNETIYKNVKRKISKISKKGYLIVKSSGTTGPSKNICLSFSKLWDSGENFCKMHDVSSNSVFWNYLPFSYLGGLFNLLILPATSASTILIDRSFNSTMLLAFVSTIQNNKISHLWLVPSILKSLLILHKHSKIDLRNIGLEKIFIGTAPIDHELKKEFKKKFGIYPLENYGLSETTFLSSEIFEDAKSQKKGYLGNKIRGIKIKVKKEKKNQFGEILVKTPYLFQGYYKDGKLIKIKNNSYFPTGDIGKIENNLIKIIGRKKNIIKKGGVMILPSEIENNIKSFSNSLEVACVKKNSYLYGEDFDLFINLKKNNENINSKLKIFKNWYYKNFSKIFWPDHFYSVNEFPKTGTGKIEIYKLNKLKYKKDAF